MLEFASNTKVSIDIPHEYNGKALELTNMKYEVLDASATVLVAKTDVTSFSAATASTTVDIDTTYNTTTAKRDTRLLNCYLINADGEYIVSQVYMLKGNQLLLTPLTDSFMTFVESVLIRSKMPEEQDYFDFLSDELKSVALEEAYERIRKFQFKLGTTTYTDLTTLTTVEFAALDADFLMALKKAQVAEANAIVENSPIRDKIRAGIISETIGESSMFFSRSLPHGRLSGLSDEAYEYLKRYIYRDTTSAMVWKVNRA